MHILISILGSIVTILWILHRLAEMGIDLGGLNPWAWRRRRRWKKAYQANPAFALDSPMEATALLITAVAKADGDMSSDEKHEILGIFENEFHLSKKDASDLLASSAYILGSGQEVRNNPKAVLTNSIEQFSEEQKESALLLLQRVAEIGAPASASQLEFINDLSSLLEKPENKDDTWH